MPPLAALDATGAAATVMTCPKIKDVTPSASSTVPLDSGTATLAVKADKAKPVSRGSGMPISAARLFSETIKEIELWLNMKSPLV